MANLDLIQLHSKDDVEVLSLSRSQPNSFEVIVSRYEQPFLHKIMAIVKNREEAQDIVQDTFVKIFIHSAKFQPQDGASFKSWAYRILLNTCFSHLKKKNREREFVSAVDPEILQSFGDVEDVERKLNVEHFLFIVSKLPNLVSSILKKVMLEGKSHEDIALEEGVSVGAVRTRLHRAREEFKKTDATYNQLSTTIAKTNDA